MAVSADREAFIPCRRADLVALCLEEGKLPPAQALEFKKFCEILSAYYHFKFHAFVETLKQNYIPFDPNEDQQLLVPPTLQQRQEMQTNLLRAFQIILESANYCPLSSQMLQDAFEESSLIDLKTAVDFEDFDTVLCYYRGDIFKTLSFKKFFRKKKRNVNVFERVALLIKFKDHAYFKMKKVNLKRLRFTPGQMYVYLYKNVPKFDIELLFPNVKTSMTLKDQLLFGVPALGAAIPLLGRVAPQLLLIMSIVFFFLGMPSLVEWLKVTEEQAQNILPILVASMSLTIALGGFAFKQYTSYQAKKIRFQKKVTDTLFFRSLANNRGVFQLLTDAAEEEECKEIILVYYHVLTSSGPLTVKQLDHQIEAWMDAQLGTKVDFDIQDPIRNLSNIRGKIVAQGRSPFLPTDSKAEDQLSSEQTSLSRDSPVYERSPDDLESGSLDERTNEFTENFSQSLDVSNAHEMRALFSYDDQGHCAVLPLHDAKAVLDYVWDHAFTYANGDVNGADADDSL
ncbi:MAG: TMEM143 family protein [Elainellaceae cyanobacterium]